MNSLMQSWLCTGRKQQLQWRTIQVIIIIPCLGGAIMEGGSSTYLSWHPECYVSQQLLLPLSAYFLQQDSPSPKIGLSWHLRQQMNYFFTWCSSCNCKVWGSSGSSSGFRGFLVRFRLTNSPNTCLLPGILPSYEPPSQGEDVIGCRSI